LENVDHFSNNFLSVPYKGERESK